MNSENSAKQLKRSRRIAIVLGTMSVITVFAFVYARIQSLEADAQTQRAIEIEQSCKKQVEEIKAEQEIANKALQLALQQLQIEKSKVELLRETK